MEIHVSFPAPATVGSLFGLIIRADSKAHQNEFQTAAAVYQTLQSHRRQPTDKTFSKNLITHHR